MASGALLSLLALALLSACSSSKKKHGDSAADAAAEGAAEAAAPALPTCQNPKPYTLLDPSPTGYIACDGNSLHRESQVTCPSRIPRASQCPSGDCKLDSECTAKSNGYCTTSSSSALCYCDYGCTTDADCGSGFVCLCAEPVGRCVKAQCATDADCNGLLCLKTSDTTCSEIFACQTPKDTCASNADCTGSLACLFVGDHHECRDRGRCP